MYCTCTVHTHKKCEPGLFVKILWIKVEYAVYTEIILCVSGLIKCDRHLFLLIGQKFFVSCRYARLYVENLHCRWDLTMTAHASLPSSDHFFLHGQMNFCCPDFTQSWVFREPVQAYPVVWCIASPCHDTSSRHSRFLPRNFEDFLGTIL